MAQKPNKQTFYRLTVNTLSVEFVPTLKAGIAQLVEHNLAKVGVASSSLVSRSNIINIGFRRSPAFYVAEWQNGYAADCKSVDLGSTPGSASI